MCIFCVKCDFSQRTISLCIGESNLIIFIHIWYVVKQHNLMWHGHQTYIKMCYMRHVFPSWYFMENSSSSLFHPSFSCNWDSLADGKQERKRRGYNILSIFCTWYRAVPNTNTRATQWVGNAYARHKWDHSRTCTQFTTSIHTNVYDSTASTSQQPHTILLMHYTIYVLWIRRSKTSKRMEKSTISSIQNVKYRTQKLRRRPALPTTPRQPVRVFFWCRASFV